MKENPCDRWTKRVMKALTKEPSTEHYLCPPTTVKLISTTTVGVTCNTLILVEMAL